MKKQRVRPYKSELSQVVKVDNSITVEKKTEQVSPYSEQLGKIAARQGNHRSQRHQAVMTCHMPEKYISDHGNDLSEAIASAGTGNVTRGGAGRGDVVSLWCGEGRDGYYDCIRRRCGIHMH